MATPPRRETAEPVTFGSPRFFHLESGGLLVTCAEFPAGAYLRPHVHDRTCVATTLAGAFDSRMCGRSHWSQASMVLTEPAGERHDNRFGSSGAEIVVVQPDAARSELLRPFDGLLTTINHFADTRIALLARRLSIELKHQDAVTPIAVEAIGLELLATAAHRFTPDRATQAPRWLLRVRDRLHTDAEAATLTELAAIAGVHPGHLTRAFRRYFGQSIGGYVRDRRLDWSARQLTGSSQSLSTIATAAGFSDQSHFTRVFRRRFGCPPGVFRTRRSA
jgi:AraC family transcriptional regulator